MHDFGHRHLILYAVEGCGLLNFRFFQFAQGSLSLLAPRNSCRLKYFVQDIRADLLSDLRVVAEEQLADAHRFHAPAVTKIASPLSSRVAGTASTRSTVSNLTHFCSDDGPVRA